MYLPHDLWELTWSHLHLTEESERDGMIGSSTRNTWNGRRIPQMSGERVAEYTKITKAKDEYREGEGSKKGESILLQMAELKIKIPANLSKVLDSMLRHYLEK